MKSISIRIACLITVLWPGLQIGTATAGTPLTLTVRVSKFRNDKGALICRLFSSAEGFPSKPTYRAQVRARIPGSTATCSFDKLAPGTYAVALFHDENDNGMLDTNFLGIPSEGVGVSNNRRPLVGPPSFADAKFRLSQNGALNVTLHY